MRELVRVGASSILVIILSCSDAEELHAVRVKDVVGGVLIENAIERVADGRPEGDVVGVGVGARVASGGKINSGSWSSHAPTGAMSVRSTVTTLSVVFFEFGLWLSKATRDKRLAKNVGAAGDEDTKESVQVVLAYLTVTFPIKSGVDETLKHVPSVPASGEQNNRTS